MITDSDRAQLIDFLSQHTDSQLFTAREVNAFLDFCDLMNLKTNDIIADIGEVGEALYFLLEGEAQLIVSTSNQEVVVGKIPAGEMLGEMSFFDRKPRNVRLRASKPTRLLRLPRIMYNRMRLEYPVLTVLLLEYAVISLDNLYRRTSTDVAQLNQYIYNIGK
ncbi:Crp/Fnr family transcriptional regulator [Halothiobacillus diazotrophicus]|uniref:Crp/Fnr family transcriptional regulator n=1 Tax=Halothiobacillus diazotrophicus TaxID=1860122 RepID=A0A191ZGS4_9GAMM|nr:cyclic nucleotide-binding domain-containing protein [Halothiobacillus diazotrophicus]ANJ67086.1 Crp/Fnr family transcriptional regulator [Halothiobacillus diazotrophicus]